MKRGQKRSKAQKKRDARWLRWRNLRDALHAAVFRAERDVMSDRTSVQFRVALRYAWLRMDALPPRPSP